MTLFEAVIIQIIQWQSVNGTHFCILHSYRKAILMIMLPCSSIHLCFFFISDPKVLFISDPKVIFYKNFTRHLTNLVFSASLSVLKIFKTCF